MRIIWTIRSRACSLDSDSPLEPARTAGLVDGRDARWRDLDIAQACQLRGVRVRIEPFHAEGRLKPLSLRERGWGEGTGAATHRRLGNALSCHSTLDTGSTNLKYQIELNR
ncbi:hypothetical protein XACJK2_1090030 [Xanthomonas citri pv. citri]|nr:hypothetical protein XACJK2_1090030 [Xanthomonas citri pv. citri]